MRHTVCLATHILLTLLILLLLAPVAAWAKTYTGQGMAVIVEGDNAKALELAFKSGYAKAVSNAMTSRIPPGTKGLTNYHRQKGKLISKPLPFVKSKRIQSKQVDGQVLRLVVAVEIDDGKLSRFLGQQGFLAEQTKARKKAEMPSVMILVVEELNGRPNPFPFASTIIADKLMAKGYDVLDEALVKKSIKHDQAVQGVLRGNPRAAQAVALQYGAGLLITGRAMAQSGSIKAGGMTAHGANVALQAVQADTGRILATGRGDGSYPHINAMTGQERAIEDALGKAMKRLMAGMDKKLETSEETLAVSISNINYKQLAVLKKILQKRFNSISSIRQKNFGGNVAKIDVALVDHVGRFVDEVALTDFGAFTLEVLSVNPRKVDLGLRMK